MPLKLTYEKMRNLNVPVNEGHNGAVIKGTTNNAHGFVACFHRTLENQGNAF